MSGLNDFLKGISTFNQGLSEFAQSEALRDANQELDQINKAVMDEKEKEQALNNLSQTFANRLGQAGASAAEIQSTVGRMGMTEPQQRNLDLQRQMLGQRQEEAILGAESRIMAAGQKRQGKQAELKADALTKAQEKFEGLGDVKKAREALGQASTAVELLDAGNPVADQSIKTFMARATGEVGNLTEAEREAFSGSPALARRAKRLFQKLTEGTLTDADRADIRDLAQTMAEANRNNLKVRAEKFAKGRGRALKGVGVTAQQILGVIEPDVADQNIEMIQKLQRAKEQYPSRAKEIEARIEQLKGL